MCKQVKQQLMNLKNQATLHIGNQVIMEDESPNKEESPLQDQTLKPDLIPELKREPSKDEKMETEVLPTELQFVYVASCHSEQVGKIFLEAGIPHVICID
mmetsp:Transcript_10048/g.15314  ORF Transcript_10048/g.15314 Transcript_10048/m.15314 type:complete len:100 (+) Transcript_10048:4034-4333(+)